MKCFEIPLCPLLKVTRMNKQKLNSKIRHCTRVINEYILYIVKSGELKLLQNGKEFTLLPGDMYIFNLGEMQQPLENVNCEFYYLHFDIYGVKELDISDEEYSDAIWQRKANFLKEDIYGISSYDYIKVILKQKMHFDDVNTIDGFLKVFDQNPIAYGYNTPEWRLNVSNAASRLLMKIEDKCFENSNQDFYKKSGIVYDNVKRIVEYIEEHYKENFDSKCIERDLLINFDYANRIFRKHFGYSIIKYRNRLRINTARVLLGEKSMREIATEVGFSDVYYFSRCFKKYEGVSPSEYKRYTLGLKKADDLVED
ncbi:MAG: AraC family transcriptional regulator [Ruminococcaceae bacterium]|nr:AraC family transcriptional regulator [Oscillospiraceae bacterium]